MYPITNLGDKTNKIRIIDLKQYVVTAAIGMETLTYGTSTGSVLSSVSECGLPVRGRALGDCYALPKTKDQEVEAGYQEDKGS